MRSWQTRMMKAALEFGFKPNVARFHFLRHGQTAQNNARICQGQRDVPLDEAGLDQARLAAPLLANRRIERVVASDLERVQATIKPLVDTTSWPVRLDPGLRERGFGTLEGKPIPPDLWDSGADGVEPVEMFTHRALQAATIALDEPNILIASHGGVLRVIASALEIELQAFAYANAQPLVFTREKDGYRVEALFVEGIVDATQPLPDYIASPSLTTGSLMATQA